jgi:hypothetical protein
MYVCNCRQTTIEQYLHNYTEYKIWNGYKHNVISGKDIVRRFKCSLKDLALSTANSKSFFSERNVKYMLLTLDHQMGNRERYLRYSSETPTFYQTGLAITSYDNYDLYVSIVYIYHL